VTSSGGSDGLTAAEEARAAALEAQFVADEARATAAKRAVDATDPGVKSSARGAPRVAAGGLAVTYAHEYDYDRRDLRRIALLAAVLMLLLFGIFVLVQASGIIAF
jgi:hypothetical protein